MTRYPSRRYYERIAAASGYPAKPLETVFRLAEMLARIEAAAPGELLLRGGTALNLLHLGAPRLSVDLDLDYVGAADPGIAQSRRPELSPRSRRSHRVPGTMSSGRGRAMPWRTSCCAMPTPPAGRPV
jgi:hypothetical protein